MRTAIIRRILTPTLSLVCVAHASGAQGPVGIFDAQTEIGSRRGAGSASYDPEQQTYLVAGSGHNMWNERDELHFVWKRLTGNFIFSARARFVGAGVEPHRKIGWNSATLAGDSLLASSAAPGGCSRSASCSSRRAASPQRASTKGGAPKAPAPRADSPTARQPDSGARVSMIDRLWDEFRSLPFPNRIPREVRDRVDLEMLDADAASCIQTYLAVGTLSPQQVGVLRACRAELQSLPLAALGREAGEYFGRLQALAALVLERLDSARPHGVA